MEKDVALLFELESLLPENALCQLWPGGFVGEDEYVKSL